MKENFEGHLLNSILNLRKKFESCPVGSNIIYYHELPSTQKFLKNMVENSMENIESGTSVIALEQTEGIGKANNVWYSPKGGIWLSIFLKKKMHPSKLFEVLLLSSLAICESIESISNLTCRIKWPNDIFINNKKVAGIIIDSSVTSHEVDYMIIGIGINFDINLSTIVGKLKTSYSATSLKVECKNNISVYALLESLFNLLNKRLDLIETDTKELLNNYNSRLEKSFYKIVLEDGNIIEGYLLKIDDNQTVIIQDPSHSNTISIPHCYPFETK